MEYSKKGLDLTKRFESCRHRAYLDPRGVPTIGYGHTGPDVFLGLIWSQERADCALAHDTLAAAEEASRAVKVHLSQAEFDALVDFTFNIGRGAFEGSTLLRLLNEERFREAAEEFPKWDKAAGIPLAGLLRRRLAEASLFKSGSKEEQSWQQ